VVQLRSHLSLDLGDVARVSLSFTDRAGKKVDQDMAGIIAGLREGEHFYQARCPAGAWTFSGPKGLSVTQRFDAAEVDYTWVHAYPAELNELEVELWAKKVTLGPTEHMTFRHELEVGPSAAP